MWLLENIEATSYRGVSLIHYLFCEWTEILERAFLTRFPKRKAVIADG